MALYINGIVICRNREEAFELFDFFSRLPYMHKLEGSEPKEIDNYWHVSLNPKGIGYGCSYDSELDRKNYHNSSSEIINDIYSKLRSYENFEIAIIGEEILDRFYDNTDTEITTLGDVLVPHNLVEERGLVVSARIYESLRNKKGFENFSKHNYWRVLVE